MAKNRKETIHAAKIYSPCGLSEESCRAFGTGADSHVRIYDRTGAMISKATFQIETLSDGSEVFNVVLK